MAERTTSPEAMSRRTFLSRISIALTALAGAVVTVPMVAYLLSPLIKPTLNVWVPLGTVDAFQIGETVESVYHDPSPVPWAGLTALTAVWVRRVSQEEFIVFAVNCTHLGCPVRWVQDAQLFICPCHGGVYYADGAVAAGPPPLPLFRYDYRIVNGVLEIRTRPLPVG